MFKKINKTNKIIIYIFLLFIISRLCLSFIGVSTKMILGDYIDLGENYSNQTVLNIWGTWDSAYYLNITEEGYSKETGKNQMTTLQANYAFFPLYPALIRALNLFIGNNYFSGLIISNLAFLISAFLLYKIVKYDHNEELALKSVKYLFFFPTAFIFSGLFSESIFLMLFLASYYFAIKNDWLKASFSALLLGLTRPFGILIFPILLLMYFINKSFNIKKIKADIFYIFISPLGFIAFLFYIHHLTGNFLNYLQIQYQGWGHVLSNPFIILANGLFTKDIFQFINISIFLFFFSLSVFSFKSKKLKGVYFIIIFLFSFLPLFSGMPSINSLLRYLLPIFPLYIVLASLSTKHKIIDQALSMILLLLQGFLMVFWVLKLHLIV